LRYDLGLGTLEARHLAAEMEAIIDDGREESIHQFMAANTELLGFVGPRAMIWSKYRLGSEYVADFVSVGDEGWTNDPRPLIVLVEIERANSPIFTSKGDPAAFLTHAIRQVQDWKRWVSANRDYFARDLYLRWVERSGDLDIDSRDLAVCRKLLNHFAVEYRVLAGRRTQMRVAERLRLAQMNDDLANIKILTYDAILDELMHVAQRTE